MDIQNIDLRRKDFEASHPVAKTFIFNEEAMLYSGPKVETLNGQWTTWCACIGIMHFEGLEAQTIPEGFVLVPKEPTDKMIDAGCKSINYSMTNIENSNRIYRAMIEATKEI